MFSALGSVLHVRRRTVLLLAAVAAAVAAVLGSAVQDKVTNSQSDYDDPSGQHAVARREIQRATGVDPQQGYVLLIRTRAALTPHTPPPPEVTAGVRLLRARPETRQVADYATARTPALISRDRHRTLVVASVGPMTERQTKDADTALRRAIDADPRLHGRADLGGTTIGMVQVGQVTETDLSKAEGLATPVVLVLLFFVFRGLVAALLPLVGAVFTLLFTLGGLRLVMFATRVSSGALNLAFALALGLAVDFGLLLVSRYREELATHGAGPVAVGRTLASAGRTVLFSGLTVATALATLLVFPQPYLRSMGLAGVITALSALLFALVGLPALLALLGGRVNALAPARWQRDTGADAGSCGADAGGEDRAVRRWRRIATAVMRRPVTTAVAAAALLLLVGSAALGIRFTGADASSLPTGISAGAVASAARHDFAAPTTAPMRIVLDTSTQGPSLDHYARRIGRLRGVRSVGAPVRLDARHQELDVVLPGAPLDTAARQTAERVERVSPPARARYTGVTADFLSQKQGIADRLPLALGLLAAVTLVLLFAFTGSVVLPLKALLMNALSTCAALGFLVWGFQGGHLGFAAPSGIENTTPVLIAALTFGLSTDYNVFLLSRIKEARAAGADDRTAVVEGLARTGRIVTSAALLFCVAVGALVLSRLVFVKELGLGTAFAVLVDATVVRGLLVPALMVLLGGANWWAPGPLRRLHARLRLDHDGPPAATAEPAEVVRTAN